jgi:hypothetical protein
VPEAYSPSSLRTYNVISPGKISSTYVPNNDVISDVIPRDVPGCFWNDVEAPQGPRLGMNLKAIFAIK